MPNAHVTVDLVAQDRRFQRTMGRVQRTVQATAVHMEAVAARARLMLLAGGGGVAALVKAAADQDRALKQMEAGLAATGDSVEKWSGRLQEFASEIQRVTTHGDESVMMLMAQASALGISADKMEQTVRMTVGLSKVMNSDLGAALRYVAVAMQGDFTMLRRYIPELRKTTDATEQLAIVTRTAERGFQLAQDETQTFTGSLKQAWNAVGDTGELLGTALIPSLQKLATWLRDIQPQIQAWVTANTEAIIKGAAWTAGILAAAVALPKLLALLGAAAGAASVFVKALGAARVALAAVVAMDAAAWGWKIGGALNSMGVAALAVKAQFLAMINPVTIAFAALAAGIGLAVQQMRAANALLRESEDAGRRMAGLLGAPMPADAAGREKHWQQLAEEARRERDRLNRAAEEQRGSWFGSDARAAELEELAWQQERFAHGFEARAKAAREAGDAEHSLAAAAEQSEETRTKAVEEYEQLALKLVQLGRSEREAADIRRQAAGFTDDQRRALDQMTAALLEAEEAQKRLEEAQQQAAANDQRARDRIEELAWEVYQLAGNLSDARIELERLAAVGVDPALLRDLEQLMAERDRLHAAEEHKQTIEALKREAMTEDQIRQEKLAQIEAARQAHDISEEEYRTLLDKLRVQQASTAGQFVGLLDMYRRIQGAALASGPMTAPEQVLPKVQNEARRGADAAVQSKSVLERILDLLTEVKRGLPLVGAYGR